MLNLFIVHVFMFFFGGGVLSTSNSKLHCLFMKLSSKALRLQTIVFETLSKGLTLLENIFDSCIIVLYKLVNVSLTIRSVLTTAILFCVHRWKFELCIKIYILKDSF